MSVKFGASKWSSIVDSSQDPIVRENIGVKESLQNFNLFFRFLLWGFEIRLISARCYSYMGSCGATIFSSRGISLFFYCWFMCGNNRDFWGWFLCGNSRDFRGWFLCDKSRAGRCWFLCDNTFLFSFMRFPL